MKNGILAVGLVVSLMLSSMLFNNCTNMGDSDLNTAQKISKAQWEEFFKHQTNLANQIFTTKETPAKTRSFQYSALEKFKANIAEFMEENNVLSEDSMLENPCSTNTPDAGDSIESASYAMGQIRELHTVAYFEIVKAYFDANHFAVTEEEVIQNDNLRDDEKLILSIAMPLIKQSQTARTRAVDWDENGCELQYRENLLGCAKAYMDAISSACADYKDPESFKLAMQMASSNYCDCQLAADSVHTDCVERNK